MFLHLVTCSLSRLQADEASTEDTVLLQPAHTISIPHDSQTKGPVLIQTGLRAGPGGGGGRLHLRGSTAPLWQRGAIQYCNTQKHRHYISGTAWLWQLGALQYGNTHKHRHYRSGTARLCQRGAIQDCITHKPTDIIKVALSSCDREVPSKTVTHHITHSITYRIRHIMTP